MCEAADGRKPSAGADKSFLQRLQILDGTALKLIAMVSMVCDHVGDLFLPQLVWLRVAGRLALPLFAFCIAEGYCHTHDRRRYLSRLGLFALISELPFDLARLGRLEAGHQNVMLTFFLAVAALWLYDAARARWQNKKGLLLGLAAVGIMSGLSLLLRTDYNLFAVLLVFVFYVFRHEPQWKRDLYALIYQLLLRNKGLFAWGALSFIPLLLYNGRRGRGLKWLFYVFYPGHLLLLYLLRLALAG